MVEPIRGINAQTWGQRQRKQNGTGARLRRAVRTIGADLRQAVVVSSPASRGQIAAGVAALGVGVSTIVLVGQRHAAGILPSPTALTTRFVVKRGETLWSFARHYGNPNEYILDRVDNLAKLNGLDADTRLVPGQRLLVTVGNPVEIARLQSKTQTRLAQNDIRHATH